MLIKIIQDNKGYALLLTFGLLILFTVLGLSLMTLTMSGTAKNSSREDNTQALNLAEKGIDFIVNEINTHLAEFTKDGKSRDDFIDELEKFDQNNIRYKCTFNSDGKLINGLKISTTNNSNDISLSCIKNVYPVNDENGLNNLKKKLELISIGEVDGKKKQLTTFVEVGADHIPEQLKYTLTSNGNVHLNGAVQITGDLRYKGSLTTYNRAHIKNNKGEHFWVDSLKPSIKSTSSRSNPRIVVGKDSKFYNVKDYGNEKERYFEILNLNTNYLNSVNNISELFDSTVFDKVPTVITTDSKINSVDFLSKKRAYEYSKSTSNENIIAKENKFLWWTTSYFISPGDYKNKSYLVKADCILWQCKYPALESDQTANIEGGNYTFNQLATNSSLFINGGSKLTKVNIKNTLYVNGDLTITGDVEISGSIFVNGRLRIYQSNLKTNALIYVNNPQSGTCNINGVRDTCEPVDIQYSTINSLPYINNNKEPANGTLVIFSKGNVKLSNNSVWSTHNNPSEIYGYFYSDSDLEIYGSGSNMKIHGGVYGQRITLHAIRGNAKDSSFKDSIPYGSYHFLNSTEQDNNSIKNITQLVGDSSCNFPDKNNQKKCYDYHSRLQIHYNEDVINTYIELNREEELIYKVDPPKFVERK